MSTKSLLFASILLVFLAGWAFGFSLGGMQPKAKVLTASEREQLYYDNWQAARSSSTDPADNFRVSVVTAAHDYAYGLSEAVRAVGRGGDIRTVTPVTDARVKSLVAPFDSVVSKSAQAQHQQLWMAMTAAMFDYGAAKNLNDETGVKAAADTVTATTTQLTRFYSGLGVQTPVTVLQAGITRAMVKIQQSIDAANGGSLLTVYESEQRAALELGSTIDLITADVVKANAHRF